MLPITAAVFIRAGKYQGEYDGRPMNVIAPLLALVVSVALAAGVGDSARAAGPRPTTTDSAHATRDTSIDAHLIQPDQLALELHYPAPRRPVVLQVGFKVLYRTGHIAGSRYVGPGSKSDGIAALGKALKGLPKEQRVVLYCGCCPWQDCPNVRPALREALRLGRRNVDVLYIHKNLQEDWIAKGFPMREGDP